MNKEIQAKWTAALRSGKYRQGSGTLKTANGDFCCLGVLCELAVQEGVISPVEEIAESSGRVLGYKYGTETGVLPVTVQEWAGLDDIEGTYEMSDSEMYTRYGHGWKDEVCYRKTSLINANDSYGKDFPQIADLIEKHF